MVVKVYCDMCGQLMNTNTASGVYPILAVSVQAPAPSTAPNLCSYDCAAAWLAARKQKDVANGVTLTAPAGGTAPAVSVTPM